MINPMIANKELCDIVLPYYGLNPLVAAKLVDNPNMNPVTKAVFSNISNIELYHKMRKDFRMYEIEKQKS